MTTALAAVVALGVTDAPAENGTSQAQNRTLSQHQAFVVVKQPGKGICRIEQAHSNSPSNLALRFDGTTLIIVAPYERGLEGSIRYWIDNTPKHVIPKANIRAGNTFALASDVIDLMKTGRTLYVQTTPRGKPPRTEKFSLMGFTAATRALASSKCHDGKTTPAPTNLEVKLTRNSSGAAVVSGRTVLPDGMTLRISLHTEINGYYAQDTVRVHSGFYESAAFTDRGRTLPSGRYTVSISSPLMYLQPLRVQRALGGSGNAIPDGIRQRSSYDESYTVSHSVSRQLN
ncbi:invasion associated locus B family protein [Nitrococcus mobilis]|uniref:Uncharacterized protein n=1 Tax=Nitrococcus mobilis Nb-231 TaxID=314278 RepID=A4BT90_9GAMM|nr:hypothetical protein [Nitrococcus mobilis]EAR20992.1 hypothetical protein NB231_07477 [Nitrococcus mobilis Nb-231]